MGTTLRWCDEVAEPLILPYGESPKNVPNVTLPVLRSWIIQRHQKIRRDDAD